MCCTMICHIASWSYIGSYLSEIKNVSLIKAVPLVVLLPLLHCTHFNSILSDTVSLVLSFKRTLNIFRGLIARIIVFLDCLVISKCWSLSWLCVFHVMSPGCSLPLIGKTQGGWFQSWVVCICFSKFGEKLFPVLFDSLMIIKLQVEAEQLWWSSWKIGSPSWLGWSIKNKAYIT